MQRTSIRIRADDLARIRHLASVMGVSQEKCMTIILEKAEADLESGELVLRQNVDTEAIAADIKQVKRLLYRIIRADYPLIESDADDPESGLSSIIDVYEDKNRHPEKYKEEEQGNDGNHDNN